MDYKVHAPEQMNATFVRAFNSGQIENLMLLYQPDALLIRLDGSVARGTEEIRNELVKLLTIGVKADGYNQFALIHGDTALLRANFLITVINENGQEAQMKGSSSEVIKQQPDGSWLYVIDHPFGANPNEQTW